MSAPKIIIYVQGGLVQDVRFTEKAPAVKVEVRDYDGDGSDPRDIKDKDGFYMPYTWEKSPA